MQTDYLEPRLGCIYGKYILYSQSLLLCMVLSTMNYFLLIFQLCTIGYSTGTGMGVTTPWLLLDLFFFFLIFDNSEIQKISISFNDLKAQLACNSAIFQFPLHLFTYASIPLLHQNKIRCLKICQERKIP